MFEKPRHTIQSLHQRGLLDEGHIDTVAIRRQLNSYASLIERSNGGNYKRNFLAEYDALMRLIEVILICSGFRLGDQPHRVLKDVIDAIITNSGIHDVCDARHQAKKLSVEPSAEMRSRLASIRSQVEAAVRQETKSLLND
jgi:hypothetical protein